MRINAIKTIQLHHTVADVAIKPCGTIHAELLKKLICLALDSYVETEHVSASIVHEETMQRHGEYYRSPGYYLRLYRNRIDLTQAVLAEQANIMQHHLSEMEHNKRVISSKLAKILAKILDIDYRKLL